MRKEKMDYIIARVVNGGMIRRMFKNVERKDW